MAATGDKQKKHWVLFEIDEARSDGLREYVRASNGRAADVYANLFTPAIDAALAEFGKNRDLMVAESRAASARTAAERAIEIANRAQEEAEALRAKAGENAA